LQIKFDLILTEIVILTDWLVIIVIMGAGRFPSKCSIIRCVSAINYALTWETWKRISIYVLLVHKKCQ